MDRTVIKKPLLLAILLFPLLLLLIGYIAWPVWAPPVVRAVLANYDIELAQAEINRPGWHNLVITNMDLSYRTASQVTSLQLPEVTVSYSLKQLWQGQLQSLQIPSARLQLELPLEADTQNTSAASEPLSLALIFPDKVFSQLPVRELHVNSLQLVLPEHSGYQILSGSLHYSADLLTLNLASQANAEADLPALELSFYADRQNRLQLSLKQNATAILELDSQIIKNTSQLQGKLSINLQATSELLEQLGLLGADYLFTGNAQLHWQGPLPETLDDNSWQQLQLSGTLSGEGSFAAHGASPQNSQAIPQGQFSVAAGFEVKEGRATLNFSELSLNGQLDLSEQLASWLPAESVNKLPVTLKLTPDAQLQISFAPLELVVLQGSVDLLAGHAQSPLFAEMKLHSLKLHPQDGNSATARFQTRLMVKQLKHADISAQTMTFSGAGKASFSADQARLQFDANSSLQGKSLKLDQTQIAAVDINMPRAFELVWQPQQLIVPELELQFASTQLRHQQQDFQFSAAQVKLKDFLLDLENIPQSHGVIDTSVKGIQLSTGDLRVKPLNLKGNWQLKSNTVQASLQLNDNAGLVVVNGELTHNLGSGRGQLTTQLQGMEFHQNKSYFPRLIENWHHPFDLFAGQLDMNSKLTWDNSQLYVKGRLQLHDIGGFYDTNLFYGLNTEVQIDGPLADIKVRAESFKVAKMDVGIEVKNVTMSLHSSLDNLHIADFQAELLGGTIGQKRISYNWTQPKNTLLLELQGLQLSELLELEPGIEGYGVLDGQLPLSISADGISVVKGQIKARLPGGVIKYQSGQSVSAAAASVGVGFAFEALSNFHYEALDVKANYSETGELNLGVALLGRNPEMQEQRPVRYNINISENIPALIKSIKLTQDIGADIERRLTKFYKRDKQEVTP